ncbi:SCP2 [Branchiostoma lanceolatum]|uniref:SCP2 protein n=1 Tax=Branchiostoma lanceolatum TaxID=7740 RepID=A0A8K0E809_BRALA|nr:SCP2 [Branchiostoma lanceolatum]
MRVLLEHILTSTMRDHLEHHSILCSVISDLASEEEGRVKHNYWSLRKSFANAFNKVSLLQHKLRHYGINGEIGAWITAFLTDRTQVVVVNGLAQCAELSWQLRGLAGKRQVPGVKLGLQHNIGLGGAVVISLYRHGFPEYCR